MKGRTFLMIFMTLIMASAAASAQQTGGLTADNLYQFLSRQGTVTAKMAGHDGVTVLAKANGSELCSVRFTGPQVVTISRSIAKVDLRSAAAARVIRAMSTFNISAPVGTLLLDEKTGALRMEHHLNPQSVSMESMAQIVVLFGEVANDETRLMASMIGKNMGMMVR